MKFVHANAVRRDGESKEFSSKEELSSHLHTVHEIDLSKHNIAGNGTSTSLYFDFLGKHVSVLLRCDQRIEGTLCQASPYDMLLEDAQRKKTLCPKHAVDILVLQGDVDIFGSKGEG